MQKILKWFTPVLALGVAIFIIFFLISINPSHEQNYGQPLRYKSGVIEKKPQDLWLNHFSQTQKLGYFYPINEVFIELDLDEEIVSKTIYKLSASLLDPYQLFCLKEELKQHSLKYYLKRDRDIVELLIYSRDVDRLNSLVGVLKNYKISAKVELFKEDV